MKSTFRCGAARAEITAEAAWYPLYAGFFTEEITDHYLVGALDPQFARAIAVQNADTTVLLVSMDLGGVPDGEKMADMISEATGVPAEQVFLIATHTHNVPALGHRCKLSEDKNFAHFAQVNPDGARRQLLYEQRVWDGVLSAAKGAMAALRPAKLGIGYSESYVNVNRDQIYDGNGKFHMGYNGAGHSDKTLALISFKDENDKTIAVFANYAVHAIVMFLNRCINGKGGSTGDLPGVVCNAYETYHPGTVCMWSPAANGNQNPIFMTYFGYPDFETGLVKESTIEGGAYEYLTVLAGRHYADLLRAERNVTDYTDAIELSAMREPQMLPINTAIPPRFGPEPDDVNGFRKLYTSGLMLGNIFLYGVGGELYSNVGAHLKEISPYRHTLICSQCYKTVGYLMDDENLLAPTLFASGTRWLPGTIVPALENFLKHFTA